MEGLQYIPKCKTQLADREIDATLAAAYRWLRQRAAELEASDQAAQAGAALPVATETTGEGAQ